MFVHTVIMVIEPHMKQGRQHKLISTIFLATSVTKKLDHNTHRLSIPANSCDNHSNPSELRHWTSLVQSEVLLVQYTHTIDGIDHLPVLLTDTESADCTF